MGRLIFLWCLCLSQWAFSQSKIIFDQQDHEFGQIYETDGLVSRQFIFTNVGKEPVMVRKVEMSCGCLSAQFTEKSVAPGERGYVTLTYDPKGRVGIFDRTAHITFDNMAEPLMLQVRGRVEERVMLAGAAPVEATAPRQTAKTARKEAAKVAPEYAARRAPEQIFRQELGFNVDSINIESVEFQQFISNLLTVVDEDTTVVIFIEASASRVPTRRKGGNIGLASSRAAKAKASLVRLLAAKGVNTKRLRFELLDTVQGPVYNRQLDTSEKVQTYQPFQYVQMRMQRKNIF